MANYLLAFCTKDTDILDDQTNRRYWRCEAESYEHAVEQLKGRVPDVNFCELIKKETSNG